MTQYIKREKVLVEKLSCDHPKVYKIWETGALAAIETSTEMVHSVHIMLKDFTRKDFSGTKDGEAIEKAEQYLSTLPTE